VSETTRVTALALGWTAALGVLAYEWTRTPLSGPGLAFVIWSLPAIPLAALSWVWLRRLELRQLPMRAPLAALVLAAWAAVALVTATGLGAEWELDGIVLRNAPQRVAGVGLRWLPGAWGALLSIAGLAAALEARYRLTHADDAADAVPAVTPIGP
jgi:hypothetical protein